MSGILFDMRVSGSDLIFALTNVRKVTLENGTRFLTLADSDTTYNVHHRKALHLLLGLA